MWGEYVPVATRKANAKKEMEKLRKKGKAIEPVEINGKEIAKEFWGKKWCDHLESFADYENRLPRGRTYVRNGSVCHLGITQGSCDAMVSGSSIYKVSVSMKTLAKEKWEAIKKACAGRIASILELLQGKLSAHVMEVVSHKKDGLFPASKEISYSCSCPDWAGMCKHVAAVLYGIANRLDQRPELLFVLRGVDASELINAELNISTQSSSQDLADGDLADIFGIDIDMDVVKAKVAAPKKRAASTAKKSISSKVKAQKKQFLDVDRLTAEALIAFRKALGFTVAAFAEQLQVTAASVYRWESCSGIISMQERPKSALRMLAAK